MPTEGLAGKTMPVHLSPPHMRIMFTLPLPRLSAPSQAVHPGERMLRPLDDVAAFAVSKAFQPDKQLLNRVAEARRRAVGSPFPVTFGG
jgi:hypothetical protein